jgi:hypothetical protein
MRGWMRFEAADYTGLDFKIGLAGLTEAVAALKNSCGMTDKNTLRGTNREVTIKPVGTE